MKKILFTCAFCWVSLFSYSQQNSSSLSVAGGIADKKGIGAMVNYTYSVNRSNYEISVIHSRFKNEVFYPIEYNVTTLNLGYLKTLIRNVNNSIFINLGAGLTGGYESVPKPNPPAVLYSKSGFVAGVYVVLEADFYLSDNFALLLRAQENYLILTSTGKYSPNFTGGIKFNL